MAELIALRLPDELGRELLRVSRMEGTDRSALVRELIGFGLAQKRLDRAVERYQTGKASAGKAAQEAGVSLWRWLELMEERGVEAQYSRRELQADLEAARR
jgi:hypothetical protein